jgi:hypothetical protein
MRTSVTWIMTAKVWLLALAMATAAQGQEAAIFGTSSRGDHCHRAEMGAGG